MRWNRPLGCLGLDICWVFLDWEELWCTVGWSLNRATSNHLGNSSRRLGGGIFDPTRFVPETSWHPFSMVGGCLITMQIHHNESRGYTCDSKVLETPVSGCFAPGLLRCALFFTVLSSSSCLCHSTLKDLELCLGVFLLLVISSFYLTALAHKSVCVLSSSSSSLWLSANASSALEAIRLFRKVGLQI